MVATLPKAHAFAITDTVIVPRDFFEYIRIDALSNTALEYSIESNATISAAFMTSPQFSSFNDSMSGVSNSLYYQNGTHSQHSLRLGSGTYYFVFYAYSATANVSYSYHISPNNPFQYGNPAPPQPTGITSFGLYNDSNNVASYDINTSRLAGVANITSLLAYNATASRAGVSIYGATLQLNSMLVVTDVGGSQQVYWCQNVLDFVTNDSIVSFGDNVWNFSDSRYFLSNNTISSSSGGFVGSFDSQGMTQYYYGYASLNFTYQMPLSLVLVMNESLLPGRGVMLQMGTQILGNGSLSATPVDWFDNITIPDPSIQSARFFTSGDDSTPTGYFYDTELVFGGEANGESTSFRQMSASLGLFYLNESRMVSFPSLYSFGGDTLESADNIQVSYSGDGYPQVTVGTPVYQYLGRASGGLSYPVGATIPEFNSEGFLMALLVAISAAGILTRTRRERDGRKEYLSS